MIQIDSGIVAVIITVLIAIIGLSVAWGTLREKVKRNRQDIDNFIEANTKEHDKIFTIVNDTRVSVGRIESTLNNRKRHEAK